MLEQGRVVVSGKREKEFWFRVKSEEDADEWVNAISFYIDKNKRNSWRRFSVDKFWKFRMITVQELEMVVSTGDILLFTSNHVVSKFQRALTQSRFGTFPAD